MTNEIDYNKYIESVFDQISEIEMQFEELMYIVSEEINRSMLEQGMNKATLAAKMDVSRPYVTKLLRGSENVSLQTLAKISVALNKKIHIALRPRDWECVTFAVSPRSSEKRRERFDGFLEQETSSYATA